MRSSCIKHPEKDKLIIIRKWQIEFCDGNECAAALLSYFEYWHNIRIDQAKKSYEYNNMAEMHGDNRVQDESFYQFHTLKDLSDAILIFGMTAIKPAIKLLNEKKVISIHRNPNKRYAFDRTQYFMFYPNRLNEWLETFYRLDESDSSRVGNDSLKVGSDSAITETSCREYINPVVPLKNIPSVDESTSPNSANASLGHPPFCQTEKDNSEASDLSYYPVDTHSPDRLTKKKEKVPAKKKKERYLDHDLIIAAYHECLPDNPKVLKMTPKRASHVDKLMREYPKSRDITWWHTYFGIIAHDPFYTGKNNRGWKADFEFCVRPSTVLRIREQNS